MLLGMEACARVIITLREDARASRAAPPVLPETVASPELGWERLPNFQGRLAYDFGQARSEVRRTRLSELRHLAGRRPADAPHRCHRRLQHLRLGRAARVGIRRGAGPRSAARRRHQPGNAGIQLLPGVPRARQVRRGAQAGGHHRIVQLQRPALRPEQEHRWRRQVHQICRWDEPGSCLPAGEQDLSRQAHEWRHAEGRPDQGGAGSRDGRAQPRGACTARQLPRQPAQDRRVQAAPGAFR